MHLNSNNYNVNICIFIQSHATDIVLNVIISYVSKFQLHPSKYYNFMFTVTSIKILQ